jgi:hypothetical protein
MNLLDEGIDQYQSTGSTLQPETLAATVHPTIDSGTGRNNWI